MTNTFFLVFAGIFGLLFGSFANVVALRDNRRNTLLLGRSACPHCGHELAWFDLVPLLSFLSTGARCRYCKKALSWRYPVVEAAAAAMFVGIAWFSLKQGAALWQMILLAIAGLLLLIVSLIDLQSMEVPLEYVVPAGLIGGLAMISMGYLNWQTAGLGLLIGAGAILTIRLVWWLFTRQEGMGEGDIWIAGAVGAMAGFPLVIVVLAAAVFSGAIIGSLAVATSKKGMAAAIPFGPFLFLGLLVALGVGQAIWSWYILYL